jgi:hypothetical protein
VSSLATDLSPLTDQLSSTSSIIDGISYLQEIVATVSSSARIFFTAHSNVFTRQGPLLLAFACLDPRQPNRLSLIALGLAYLGVHSCGLTLFMVIQSAGELASTPTAIATGQMPFIVHKLRLGWDFLGNYLLRLSLAPSVLQRKACPSPASS